MTECEREVRENTKRQLEHYAKNLQGLKDLTDLRNADENTKQDYAGRFAFELLQNGADAYLKASRKNPSRYPPGMGKVSFTVTKHCLIVANTGSPFSYTPDYDEGEPISSLESISRLGESTKRSGIYMGNKGIGFRSIYQVCGRLWLFSGSQGGGYQIRYDGDWTKDQLLQRFESCLRERPDDPELEACIEYLCNPSRQVPMLRVGGWFELEELRQVDEHAEATVRRLWKDGFDTILVLDQRSMLENMQAGKTNNEQYDSQFAWRSEFAWRRLEELTEKEVLFLNTLCEVHIEDAIRTERSFTITLRREQEGGGNKQNRQIVTVTSLPRRSEPDRFLVYHLPTPALPHHPSAIAFRLGKDGKPQPAKYEERVFYTFYPATRERHGFPFYIHSYFQLSPNREYFNTASPEATEHNKHLLEYIAQSIATDVLCDLRECFPDTFLPDLVLPRLDEGQNNILQNLRGSINGNTENVLGGVDLSREDRLSGWFVMHVLRELASQPLIIDIQGNYCQLREARWAGPDLSARAGDLLMAGLDGHQRQIDSNRVPGEHQQIHPHLISTNMQLYMCLEQLADHADLLETGRLTLEDLVAAVGSAPDSSFQDPTVAKSLLVLLKELADGDEEALEQSIEKIRSKRIRVLPCDGEDGNIQPLPPVPERGKPLRASADAPLVFYPDREMDEDFESTGEESDSERATTLHIPDFCHVHRLKDAVLTAEPSQMSPDDLRALLYDLLGLRPFQPEEIFVRIGEAVLSDFDYVSKLRHSEHKDLLLTSLMLIERRRLRRAVQTREFTLQPWLKRERNDSDWKLFYFLARSWIPVAEDWVCGSEVLLAGELGEGDSLRPAYAGTEQVFLSEKNEAPWFRQWLARYFEDHSGVDSAEAHNEDFAHFRSFIYQLLGSWPVLRFEIIHHPEGRRDPKTDPRLNPHRSIDDSIWHEYVKSQPNPWARYPLEKCHLVQSAAIPHLPVLERDIESRQQLIGALTKCIDILLHFRTVEVRSPNNSPTRIPSLLAEQLRNFGWVTESRDAPTDSTIWYTRQDIPSTTHILRSAHYLRSVTSQQMEPALARAIGLPILEDPRLEYERELLDLYEQLCKRIEEDPPPGAGFLTLYRTVVTRLQQIWLDSDNPSKERIKKVRDEKVEALNRIKATGVIIHTLGKGKSRSTELRLKKTWQVIFYDDTGAQNPLFQQQLKMAAFEDNSKGIARLLGLRLLSEADVRYTDGKDGLFEGFEDVEEEAESHLRALKAPLFAFRAHASFIPEGQRLKVGEKRFRERWDEYDRLKIEVVPELWIAVDQQQPVKVPEDFRVVLQHVTGKHGKRRLFVSQSFLGEDERVPLRSLARPVAALLGAELQTIAIEMLVEQYEKGRLEQYLQEQCEVLPEHVEDIENFDEEQVRQRKNERERLFEQLLEALAEIGMFPSEGQRKSLMVIIERARSLLSPDLLEKLQNNFGVALHELARSLDWSGFEENRRRFRALRTTLRPNLLVALADRMGVIACNPQSSTQTLSADYSGARVTSQTRQSNSQVETWKNAVELYDRLRLPAELEYRFNPSRAELEKPIIGWAREYGLGEEVLPPQLDLHSLQPVDAARWQQLFPSAEQQAALVEQALAVANLILPWVIALARSASHVPVEDLVESIHAAGLQEATDSGEGIETVRDLFVTFLRQHRVSPHRIDTLLKAWPVEPEIKAIGFSEELLSQVRSEIEVIKARQQQRTAQKVKAFRRYLEQLRSKNELHIKQKELQLVPTDESTDSVKGSSSSGGEIRNSKPRGPSRKVRHLPKSEDDYVLSDFQKRVVGACGEEFVLTIQRIRWEQLCRKDSNLAKERLSEVVAHYDLDDSSEDGVHAQRLAWEHLRDSEPHTWLETEAGWTSVKRLLHMANWSSKAGYDVLGLDGDDDHPDIPSTIHRIEVKATSTISRFDFPISANEMEEAGRDGYPYVIWRVLGVQPNRSPTFFRLLDPLRLIQENKLITKAQVTVLSPSVKG